MSDKPRTSGKKSTGKFWTTERLDIWLRVGVPTLATLTLGLATIFIDHRISQRAESEQSSRLYTELISRREQAASTLRSDMFATILSGFLDSGGGGDKPIGSKQLDRDLMKLELLALNFGEALSLGPLFAMMDRRIRTDASYASKLDRVSRDAFQRRLEALARRVADAQRGSLEGQAEEFTVLVPSGKMGEIGTYVWPDPSAEDEDEIRACKVLKGIQRRFTISFDELKEDAKTIRVQLWITTTMLAQEAPKACVDALAECRADLPLLCAEFSELFTSGSRFRLNPFNLPLINNSLLSHDQRFALVMRDPDFDSEIEIVGILFPGAYAGRRDKLTLDQAINALKGRIQ